MAIQPSPSRTSRGISVVDPVAPALERVKQMLFRPFDLAKWITIGFCAWLAGLGESGGGGNFNFGNYGGGGGGGAKPAEEFRHYYREASDFVLTNLFWIVPVAVLIILIVVAIWLLVLWVSSRGKFMFLHCVALDKAEVAEPWKKYADAANSLFRFRIGLGLIGLVVILPLLVLIGLAVMRMVLRGEPDVAGILMTVALAFAFLIAVMVITIIRKFTMDFVVPIQYLRGGRCLGAWGEFFNLLAANPWEFVLYILFQIVLTMAIGTLVVLVVLVTCCIAGCLMLLPFIGTVLLLPLLVFSRAYSLYYLAQFGHDVFLVPTVEQPAPPPIP